MMCKMFIYPPPCPQSSVLRVAKVVKLPKDIPEDAVATSIPADIVEIPRKSKTTIYIKTEPPGYYVLHEEKVEKWEGKYGLVYEVYKREVGVCTKCPLFKSHDPNLLNTFPCTISFSEDDFDIKVNGAMAFPISDIDKLLDAAKTRKLRTWLKNAAKLSKTREIIVITC